MVTGVSGSGKSTLAFDIVFAEGQRRYLESLNAYARQFVEPATRPDVDAIFGIPPTVAIEQRVSRGGRKSTVATLTEIHHFLRLLYVKLGTQYCPQCDVPIEPQSVAAIAARIVREHRGTRVGLLAPLVVNRKGYYTDLAKWARGKGYTHLRVDGTFIPTRAWPRLSRFQEHTIELPVADVRAAPEHESQLRAALQSALDHGKGVVHVIAPLEALERAMAERNPALARMSQTVFSVKRACPSCGTSFPELDPRLFSYNSRHGWCTACYGTGLSDGRLRRGAERRGDLVERLVRRGVDSLRFVRRKSTESKPRWRCVFEDVPLPICPGCPYRPSRNSSAISGSRDARRRSPGTSWPSSPAASPSCAKSASPISRSIARRPRSRAARRSAYGSRRSSAPTCAAWPTSSTSPPSASIPRDNRVLLATLEKLEAKGNTLIVVEHDEETIRRAAHVVDLGPGAGSRGGEVVAAGSAAT